MPHIYTYIVLTNACIQLYIHVLDSYAWYISLHICFVQVTLKLDPETEIKKFGPKAGPLDEIEVFIVVN